MSILRRLWPRRKAMDLITMGVHVVAVPKPTRWADREPEDGIDSFCWYGHWTGTHWDWELATGPHHWQTHWLPATTEVLPARCCAPEVE